MSRSFLIFLLVVFTIACAGQEIKAQAEFPPRTIRPDEKVTLDSSLPLNTALEILSQYSKKHDGKIIIDAQNRRSPINVMVNNMYWKRALEFVLRSNLMKYQEKERYYEVMPMVESQAGGEGIEVTTASNEVEIVALFFEADYRTVRQAGINWRLNDLPNGNVTVNNTFMNQVQGASQQFTAQYNASTSVVNIFALLSLMESMNKGEVIANPQIKVLENETGRIKVGQNFFLTTQDFSGNTLFQEYEAGIILTVTPQLIRNEDTTFIHLDIKAERSNVVPAAQAVTKSITESSTQVLMLSGEETVMAGLFSNSTTKVRQGVPILKDLPPWLFGLRYVFGYNSTDIQKKELIIVLQANIVPSIAERIAARNVNYKASLDKRRQAFLRKIQQLKSSNGAYDRSQAKRPVKKRRN